MMTQPLAFWPWPVNPAHLAMVKQAKATLDLEFNVVPVQAVPGGPVRVLALGSLPPFVCDAALIRDPTNADSVLAGLGWVLTAEDGDDRGFMVLDYLTEILGEGVVEVDEEDDENGAGLDAWGVRTGGHQGAQHRVAFR